MPKHSARRPYLAFIDSDIDLVPMIDCIFLILLFFMLCGHITMSEREEQITVPPAMTACKPPDPAGWRREVINIMPSTTLGALRVKIGSGFDSVGLSEAEACVRLRMHLDAFYDNAELYPDPAVIGRRLPQVVIVLRADGDVSFRTLQTMQQLLADSIDPASGMPHDRGALARPFPNLEFATRDPSGH